MTERPDVTVVIPTRDRWSLFLDHALASALAQVGVRHEIVVVDDGSVEARRDAEALGDPRVRVVRREQPGGMAAARNDGIAAARGEWVAFLDDDDLWSPHKLQRQLELVSEGSTSWAYGGAIALDVVADVVSHLYLPPAHEVRDKLRRACVIPAGPSNVLVRTELVRSLGGFDESFVHLGDWDLWLALADEGPPAVSEEILIAYVLHAGNIHARDDPSVELDALIRKHASASPPRMLVPDRLGYSRWVAGQRSRTGLHREAAAAYLRSGVRYRSPGNVLRAADALLSKRPSAALRRIRPLPPEPPVTRPAWLRRFAS